MLSRCCWWTWSDSLMLFYYTNHYHNHHHHRSWKTPMQASLTSTSNLLFLPVEVCFLTMINFISLVVGFIRRGLTHLTKSEYLHIVLYCKLTLTTYIFPKYPHIQTTITQDNNKSPSHHTRSRQASIHTCFRDCSLAPSAPFPLWKVLGH